MGKKTRALGWFRGTVPITGFGLLAALLGPFAGCSTSDSKGAPCVEVCDCVKSASQDPGARQSCLDQCGTSMASPSGDPIAACLKFLSSTGYPQCTNSCQAFAPAPRDLGPCAGFRETSRTTCTATGQREPQNDQSCFAVISTGLSGYCECKDGNVPLDCGHATGTCDHACHNGYFGDFTSGAGGATGSGGASGDASYDAPTGTGGRGYDGGDPCAGYIDAYACGANLGVDPSRLYMCSGGLTVGYVTCSSGCAAAPTGQPNYCFGTDPCINLPFDGIACGSNLANPTADQNTLYQCAAGATVGKSVCSVMCHATPGAQADYCQ